MTQVLVLYFSRGGNTRKLAEQSPMEFGKYRGCKPCCGIPMKSPRMIS